ncbi:MAG: hypothetical protein WCI11_07790 [Candidatus Methylumidiphilus sp.]
MALIIQATTPPTGPSASGSEEYAIAPTGTGTLIAILPGTAHRGVTGMGMFPAIGITPGMDKSQESGIPTATPM